LLYLYIVKREELSIHRFKTSNYFLYYVNRNETLSRYSTIKVSGRLIKHFVYFGSFKIMRKIHLKSKI